MATVTALVVVIAACGEDTNATLPGVLDTSTDNKEGADNNNPDGPGTQDGTPESPYPALPSVLSLSGCDAVGLGPLCSLTQNESNLRVNCGGRIFEGTVSEIGDVTFASASGAEASGAGPLSCKGRFIAGQVTATCSRTGASGQAETCNVVSDRQILPGVTCLELPSQLESVTLCASGDEKGGKTIQAGTCKVIQDGCIFQAECADDVVFTGTVSRTGVDFAQQLIALEDAQTPANGEPAFLKGQVVAHACSAELSGTSLTGSCGAGAAGRGGVNTSVCGVTGKATSLPPTCGPLSDANEKLFALDSCEMLRDGAGPGEPGIGQPVCAFRQNNCIWEVNCGNDPMLTFTGRSTPGASRVEWKLFTGTPCEASFDSAGNISGSCTVPGQPACAIGNLKSPTPGSASCPALPLGTNFTTNGCGGGVTIDCRLSLQHECDFMAICSYSARYPDFVVAGTSSFIDGRPHLSFNGLADYKCYVDKATEEEISSGDRQSNEWYGQCTNSVGGQCRDNYNPVTKTGFRGLRLYFGDEGN